MDWLKPLSSRGVSSAGDNNDTQVGWLRVAQGKAQPQHIALARQVFAQHLNEIAWSLAGYHTLDYRMTDGSVLRIISNSGIHQATLWVPDSEPTLEALRGFVLSPKLQDGALFTYAKKTALVWYVGADWAKKQSPYDPGRDATPTYFVDETLRTKLSVTVASDTRYADVFSLYGPSMFLNGQLYASVAEPASPSIPVPLRTPGEPTVWFAVADDGVRRFSSGSLSDVWLRSSSSLGDGPSGQGLELGVKYARADETATYATLRLLDTGAFQRRYAEIVLQRTSPWHTTPGVQFAQINVPSVFVTSGGYTGSGTAVPSEMLVPLQTTNATKLAGKYPFISGGGTVSLEEILHSGTQSTPDTLTRLEYARSFVAPDSGSMEIMPGLDAQWERGVVIDSVHNTTAGNAIFWYNEWELGPIWTYPSIPTSPSLADFALNPRSGGAIIQPGDWFNDAKIEIGGKLVHGDTSTSQTTLVGYGDLFISTVAHGIVHSEVDSFEENAPDPPGSIAENGVIYTTDNGATYFDTGWPFIKQVPTGYDKTEFDTTSRQETVSVAGAARDYVFFDAESEVYVYLRSEITATSSSLVETNNGDETSSASGNFRLTVELVLESPATGEVSELVYEFDEDTTFSFNTQLPDDISQSEGNRVWKYVVPPLVPPVFAPKWMHQGLCPFIAYTTVAELASATEASLTMAQRLIASFRLQILFLARPDLYPVPEVIGATQVAAPMMEALLQAHYGALYFYTFSGIEEVPAVLNIAYPAGDPHAAIGVTGTDPHSEAYRT